MRSRELCGSKPLSAELTYAGDFQRPLRLVCWDWDRDGSHDLIGQVDVSLHDLLDMASSGSELLYPIHMGKMTSESHNVTSPCP